MRVAIVSPRVNSTPLPELGIAYLAGYIRQHNHVDVRVFDANTLRGGDDELLKILLEFSPDVIGMAAQHSVNHWNYISFLRKLRTVFESKFIAVGGNHATCCAEAFLGADLANVVVLGEGEETFSGLIKDMRQERSWSRQLGVCFFDESSDDIKRNSARPFIEDLDTIPFPAMDLLPFDFYESVERVLPTMLYHGRVCGWMFQERGCPYNCIYCSSSKTMGKKPRYHSLGYLMELIEHRLEQFSLDHIFFFDDVFTFDRNRTKRFCEALLERRLDIVWGCQTRADLVDRELLDLMRRAGCSLIEYGLESADNSILKSLKKQITVEQVEHTIQETFRQGIPMQVNIMLGHLEETEDSILKGIDFGRNILEDYGALPCYWTVTPFPGTELFEKATSLGVIEGHFARQYTTPTPESLNRSLEAFLAMNLSEDRFSELLEMAWTQDIDAVQEWFASDKLLVRALRYHSMTLSKYLEHLFPRGVGNFIESRFFVTGYPKEDLWNLQGA